MIELSELKIGDEVLIEIPTQSLSGTFNNRYNATVLEKFYDELGDYVKLRVYPTILFEEPMYIRSGENIVWKN